MSKITVGELGSYIRDQRNSAQISLRQLAKLAGVSNPYLSQIERGLRRPSAEILQQIAKALRISAEALYIQAGILDERPDSSTVTDALHSDRTLSDRQKQVLLEIYDSFRHENEGRSSAAEPVADVTAAPAGDSAAAAAADSVTAAPPELPAKPRRPRKPSGEAAAATKPARRKAG